MVLNVMIDQNEWESVQADIGLATSVANTYIFLDVGFTANGDAVPNSPTTLQVGTFTPNANPPLLLGSIIDLEARFLGLFFSEGVNISTIVPTAVSFSFTNSETGTRQNHTLTGGSAIAPFGGATNQIGILLLPGDFDIIRLAASDPAGVLVILAADAAYDGNGMPNIFQDDVRILQVFNDSTAPGVNMFSLDLNSGMMSLVFSEVIQSGIDYSQFYLTREASTTLNDSLSLAGSVLISETIFSETTLDIALSSVTLDAIKADINLCSTAQNCFLFWGNDSFSDANNNSATQLPFSVQVGDLTSDRTRPRLVSFSIDLNSGSLNLTFDEPVNSDNFSITAIILTDGALQQAANGTILRTEGASALGIDVSFLLDTSSLNFAKTLSSPRLAIERSATSDAAGNLLQAIEIASSLPPLFLISDQTPPTLLGFNPSDPSMRQIVLTFDEFVNTAAWNGNQLFLTLQVSTGDVMYSSFTSGALTPPISNRITYTFSNADFTSVFSSQYTEAYNSGAIVLRAEEGLIQDVSSNPLGDSESFVYSTQPPDVTRPTFTGFNLDMNIGQVQMTFSEPVNILSSAGQIQFIDNSNIFLVSQVYNLVNNGSFGTGMGPQIIVDLVLDVDDLNALKVNQQLCTSSSDSFMLVLSDLAQDRSGNDIEPGTSGIQVNVYTPDITPPAITNFDFDINVGQLVIQFSEPILMDQESLNFSFFRLASSSSSQDGIYITDGLVIGAANFDSLLTILIPVTVLNSVKFDRSICTSISNCYLNAASSSYRDTSENVVAMRVINTATSSFTPDTTPPELIRYNLDMNTGSVVLTYSEPINDVTFNPTGLTFVSSNASSLTYTLVDAFVSRTEMLNTIVDLTLGPTSLNQVKLLSRGSLLHLAMMSSTTADLVQLPNPVVPIPTASPLSPSLFVLDTSPPRLLRFTPGFPNQTDITFGFNEFVDGSSLHEEQFVIRLTTRQGTFEYSSFRNGRITSAVVTDQLTYTFSQTDFNATLRDQYSEAISSGSVSLLVGDNFISDLNDNVLVPIATPLLYTTDITRPTLIGFILDLNMGFVDLSFSEPVNVISIAGMARFQNAAESPSVVISLTQNGTLTPPFVSSDAVVVTLGETDLNNIKTSTGIGTSVANTFLALEETFALDLSGNLFSPGTNALQASNVILDTSRPFLDTFTFDANQGIITLQFSETISVATIDLSQIYLTGMQQNSVPSGYSLSGSTVASGANFSQTVMLSASLSLLNTIKADLQVCSSRSNCFIFIAGGALADVSGNMIIPSSTGTIATSLVQDVTQPRLLSYTMDLNSGGIVLTFSEPVLVQGFSPSGITALAASLSEQLGDVTILGTEAFDTIIRLSMGSNLLNQLKVLDSTTGSITLSISSITVTDTSSLSVVPIPPSNSLAPAIFVPDITSPSLLQIIPSSGVLGFTLIFDEFVQPSSIATNLLSFRLKNRNGQSDYANLGSALVTADISDRVTLTFPPSETRFTESSFLQLYALSFSEGSICLNLATSFVRDVSGNRYMGNLLAVYSNTTDTERPRLVSFILNLNTSILNMTFSEEVNVLAIAGNVRLQNGATLPTSVYNLMSGTVLNTQGRASNVVSVSIASSDLDNIVNNPSLASSVSTTYLLLLEAFAVDFSGNFLNDSQGGVQARQVIQVIRGTMILSFDLDLDSNIMRLQFDRGVSISTFQPAQITLTNVSSPAEMERIDVQLSAAEVLSPPESVVSTFRFLLRTNDIISIKSSPLCYDRSNCFANFMRELILDVTGNSSIPTVLQVDSLFADVSPPRLEAYSEFDLNQGTFTLIFNEPVNTSSTDYTDIQFSNRITNPTRLITLREGFATRDHIEIDFTISERDLNALKLIPDLCTSTDNCWVRLPSFFINDIGMNPFLHSNFQPDAQASFHQPRTFINDVTPPLLLEFSVDIDRGSMSLFFSEVVVQTSFYPEDLTLLNTQVGIVTFRLSTDTNFTRSPAGDAIYISFTASDLNGIKRSANLFTSSVDAYLSIVSTRLVDTSGNIFSDIPPSSALQVTNYTADETRPALISFDLYNNDNGSIIVTFDEPVDIDSLQLTSVILVSGGSDNTPFSSYTLTGGISSYLSRDELSLLITLSPSDLLAIKLDSELATSRENTFISFSAAVVLDKAGNSAIEVPTSTPLQLSRNGFLSDASRASLAGYTFDLNAAVISLTFTDVLNTLTLDISQLTVQNRRSAPSESYTLIDSSTTSRNFVAFDISLGLQDLNRIQSNLNLATGESDTFISFSSSLIRDINGLEVVPVLTSAAIGAATYIPDMISPLITSFSLDMDAGVLSLTFSEAVVVSNIMLTSLTIQNSQLSNSLSYSLTNGTYESASPTDINLQITLTYVDLNQIKSMNLASSLSDTYLNMTGDFITDTNNNRIQPSVLQAASYTPDIVSPMLLAFDLILTRGGVVRLQFSEAISYTSTVQLTVMLQNAMSNPSISQSLSMQDMIATLPELDTIEITLRATLLLTLIDNPNFASSSSTLYISIDDRGFSDFAGNPIVAVPSNQAMRVQFICK